MTTPTTEAGKAALAEIADDDPDARPLREDVPALLVAIEAEARAAALADVRAAVVGLPRSAADFDGNMLTPVGDGRWVLRAAVLVAIDELAR